jgi:Na+-driven multidrug efflux pump
MIKMADSGTAYMNVIIVMVLLYILINSGFSAFNAASRAAVVMVAEHRQN